MSETLLFAVGVAVFAVTVCATLLYGYFTFDRIYQADAAEHPVVDMRQATSGGAANDEPEPLISSLTAVAE